MMPPRPAINMTLHAVSPDKSAQQPGSHGSTTSASPPQAQAPGASPPVEPSARMAAELVVMLGAKMKEICEHQTVLVEQMQRMREKIDEKDEMIRRLQEHERTDTAAHVHERGRMSHELLRLKEQVQEIQSLSEAMPESVSERAPTRNRLADGVAKQVSELNIDSGDTEEDCSTIKGDDPDGEEPSTASTADDKTASRPSSVTKTSGRYYFKPTTSSARRKRRELDDLFRPQDSHHSTH